MAKTIEERAWEYARKATDFQRRERATIMMYSSRDFIAGAKSEREELLRWRNLEGEHPELMKEVLIKVMCADGQTIYRIGCLCPNGRFNFSGFEFGCSIIAWRPIEELE